MKKCVVSLMLIGMLSGLCFGANGDMGTTTNPNTNGSPEHPWLIEDLDDFDEFCGDTSYWASGVHTRLECDPNLATKGIYTQAPIAGDTDTDNTFDGTEYAGNFDGNGHVISNYTVKGADDCGLFGKVDTDGSITNLGVENISVTGSSQHVIGSGKCVGGLAGRNSGVINGCYSTGTVGNGSFVDYNGGLVGRNYGSIMDCYSTAALNSIHYHNIDYSGGLVGLNSGNIISSYSTGSVEGDDHVGGLVGHNTGNITGSYSTGLVDSPGNHIGGLVGNNKSGSITSCYSTSSVNGDWEVGGLVGQNYDGSIISTYSTGSVNGTGMYVGGLVGVNDSNSSIIGCYSTGTVTGLDLYVGGLAGRNYGSITGSYFYIYSGPGNGCGTPLDDVQLQEISSFAGFDFAGSTSDGTEDHWTIEASYMPRLTWQDSPGFEPPYALDNIITTLVGSGDSSDPFIIADYDDFLEFRTNSSLRAGHYSLTNDIDLSGVTYTEAIIADIFRGIFNGNGHVLSNLTIDGEGSLGVFSILYGYVNALGLENISIVGTREYVGGLAGESYGSLTGCYSTGSVDGYRYVGGLAGRNDGSTINNCYSTSLVTGDDYVGGLVGMNDGGHISDSYSTNSVAGDNFVGGLMGRNESGSIIASYSASPVIGYSNVGGLVGFNSKAIIIKGSITSCYSTGPVTGNQVVGGLVGNNYTGGRISNCYSTGAATGNDYIGGLAGHNVGDLSSSYSTGAVTGSMTSPIENIGGLVGSDTYGRISNSYFYIFSGMDNGYGDGLDDEQLLNKSSFVGFDFAGDSSDGSEEYWTIEAGYMPRLTWQESPGYKVPVDSVTTTLSGSGYASNPFIIANYDDLMEFRNNSSLRIGQYKLTNNINLSGVTYTGAFIAEGFNGHFSGNGHVISNLTIDGDSNLGLFGILSGYVNDLALESVSITGSGDDIGSLAGKSYGSIENSNSTGMVDGDDNIGGLTGSNFGSVTDSHSTCSVASYEGTGSGGLVGNNSGEIIRSNSTGSITCYQTGGGLAGLNSGNISNSYSTGSVIGPSYTGEIIGGLVGSNAYGSINNCYSTCLVSGNYNVGGLTGSNSNGSISNSYSAGSVTGNQYVGGLTGSNSNGSISNSYSTGSVTCYYGYYYGGLVGYGRPTDIVADSFWDVGTSGVGSSGDDHFGATGKTTAEMQSESTFTDAGWDFDSDDGNPANWYIPVADYPRLIWEDRLVNMNEFALLSRYWLDSGCVVGTACDVVDWYNDGTIDIHDLYLLSLNWLGDFDDLQAYKLSPMGHWAFDETSGTIAADSSVGKNDGALPNGGTWQPAGGKIAGALELDGVDDYVTLPGEILDPSQSFSVMLWVRLDEKLGTGSQVILQQEGATGRTLLYRRAGDDKLGSYFGLTPSESETAVFATTGQWHHVGLTYDQATTTMKFYIDGQLDGSNVVVGEPASGVFKIGTHKDGADINKNARWAGLIDDMRVYHRPLTQSEIAALAGD